MPGVIGEDGIFCAVAVADVQLGDDAAVDTIVIADMEIANLAPVPALAEGNIEDIFFGEQVCYIVALIFNTLIVIGPAGGHVNVAYLFAVDLRLVNTPGAGVKPGGDDFLFCLKFLAEYRAEFLPAAAVVRDPLRIKMAQQAGLKGGFGFSAAAVVIPYGDYHFVVGAWRKLYRKPNILVVGRFNFSAVIAAGNSDAVSGLQRIGLIRCKNPGKTGLLIDPHGRSLSVNGNGLDLKHKTTPVMQIL